MKKSLALIIAVLMLASFAACSGGKVDPKPTEDPKTTEAPADPTEAPADPTEAPADPTAAPKADVTPADVEAAIKAALGEGFLCEVDVPREELFSTVLIDIDMDKLNSYIAKLAVVAAVDMDQLVIAECADGYAEEAVRIIKKNHQQSLDYVEMYPFGVAKVQGARLYNVGNLVIYVLAGARYEGENAEEEAALAAAEYQKIDEAMAALFGTLPENLLG